MDIMLLIARLVLAAVFLASGLAKLADPAGSRQAMRDFRVPERLAAPAAIALPIFELVVAAALIPRATAWWGAAGALALLAAFTAGIGYTLAQGRTPACHCFGQLHSAPVGTATLLRNGALAAVSALVVLFGFDDSGSSAIAWAIDRTTGERVAMAVVAAIFLAAGVVGWLLLRMLGENGAMLVRLDGQESGSAGETSAPVPGSGLAVGDRAPTFALANLAHGTTTLDDLRAAAKPVLLLFTDPDCRPCEALMPDIGRWQRQYGQALTVALVSRGDPAANRVKAAEFGLPHVLLQHDHEVADAYGAVSTPSGVLVNPDGTIGAPAAAGPDAVRDLVVRAISQGASARLDSRASTTGLRHEPNVAGRPMIPLIQAANGTAVDERKWR